MDSFSSAVRSGASLVANMSKIIHNRNGQAIRNTPLGCHKVEIDIPHPCLLAARIFMDAQPLLVGVDALKSPSLGVIALCQ